MESMIHGKIGVSLQIEENGVEYRHIDPKLTFNISILQALSEEGKLDKVNSR